jgi:phosphoglycerate dehydrogenase-like enzyme
MYTVLADTELHRDAAEVFTGLARIVRAGKFDYDAMMARIPRADAVVLGGSLMDAKLIGTSTKLKIIARYGVGFNNVDVEAASARNILVTVTPCDELINAVAEFALGQILALAKRIVAADQYLKSDRYAAAGRWFDVPARRGYNPPSISLAGKTLGIVGLGRIGRSLAMKGHGLGLRVIYVDVVRNDRLEREHGFEYVELDELLQRSDVVSIHVPLSATTRKMVGRRELALMKSTAYLVNTARGGVIDQSALYDALRRGVIAGAALDVFDEEPVPVDAPILTLGNVVASPHIAASAVESRRAIQVMACRDVAKVLRGERVDLDHVVNPEILTLAPP